VGQVTVRPWLLLPERILVQRHVTVARACSHHSPLPCGKLSALEICTARHGVVVSGWVGRICAPTVTTGHVDLAGGYGLTTNGAVGTCYHVVKFEREMRDVPARGGGRWKGPASARVLESVLSQSFSFGIRFPSIHKRRFIRLEQGMGVFLPNFQGFATSSAWPALAELLPGRKPGPDIPALA
jgi:hypothetical protein